MLRVAGGAPCRCCRRQVSAVGAIWPCIRTPLALRGRGVHELITHQSQPASQPRSFPAPASAAGAGPAGDGSTRQAVQEHVERAAKLIDEMLEEIMRALFVEQAAAYISDEGASLTEEEAVRSAVVQRIEFLDANFLGALNGYLEVMKKQSGAGRELLPLLELLRNEVLYQVSLRLPPAARVLNRALKEVDKEQRVEVLRTALAGGAGDLPGCDADGLTTASSQFIDDMEDQHEVVDRVLLARLCLLREEVRWVSAEAQFTRPAASDGSGDQPSSTSSTSSSTVHFVRSNVPQRPATFINQLVSVNEQATRVGLISRTFCEDWDGAAPRQKPQSALQKGQPDYVRPGRFMATLQAMIQNLEGEGTIEPPHNVAPGLLRRLADIQMEAITVLDRMQRGDLKPA